MWSRLVLGVVPGLVLAGCGFRSSAASGGSDAGPADAAIDAGDGPGAGTDCWAHWMDGSVAIDGSTVKEIMELSSPGHDAEPWISSDGLRMYFSRDLTPPGHGDIYFASRSSATGSFAAAVPVTNLNTDGQEGRAWLTSDELGMALSTTHDGPLNINMNTRPADQKFGTPDNRHMMMVNVTGSQHYDPFVTDDLLRLYFSANTGPGGKLELWFATRSTATGDFDPPSHVPGINSASLNEFGAALYLGEQLLLYTAAQNGETFELWYAMRPTATGNFGGAAKIPAVNGPANDIDPVLSHDGCELYFASDRDPGGRYHLFHARITK